MTLHKLKLAGIAIFVGMLSACSNMQTEVEKYERKCATLLLDPDILECYQAANSEFISRRISIAMRGLTEGDLPHNFQMLVQLQVEYDGKFNVVSVLNSSKSRILDKKILQTIENIDRLFVPRNRLFDEANFGGMKLLVKPARTPILVEENLLDNHALVIYVNKIRR